MQVGFGVRDVRRFTGHDLTQQRTQCKNVGACRQGVRTASGLLGWHKSQGTKYKTLAGQGARMLFKLLRNRSVRIGIARRVSNRLNDRFHVCLLWGQSVKGGRALRAHLVAQNRSVRG